MIEVRAYVSPERRQIDLFVVDEDAIGTSIVMEKSEYNLHPEPTIVLADRNNAAQILMDDLWNAGIRPTEGSGSAGSMGAIQNHLKDLQRMLFDDIRTRPIQARTGKKA